MDYYASHSNIHAHKKVTAHKVIIHRNERNILSILFDEINCSAEKFDKVKKEIYWIAGVIVAGINFVFFLIEKAGIR